MRVTNAAVDGGLVEVQAGKVARICGVAKAKVNAVCAVVDGGFECWQAASRADELH
jgi:hypothetical protein